MTEETIEQEILRKGLTAPRVTPADVEANIVAEYYFTAHDGLHGKADRMGNIVTDDGHLVTLGLLTFCVLVLRNGFTAHGHSACASPVNYDERVGQRVARENAVRAIWPLMGYALKDRLLEQAAKTDAR